jgi:hypothetical protein
MAMRALFDHYNMLAVAAMMAADTPVSAAASPETPPEEPVSIPKPKESRLAKFKSTNLTPEKVAALVTGLPHYPVADAKDFVRLHPDEENYWSTEYCFVNVPVQGQNKDTLHLIVSDLAARLSPGRVQKFRLALATKPYDIQFLAHVPSQNLDNSWNETNLQGCELAKRLWTMLTSLKSIGQEKYRIDHSKDEMEGGPAPFPEPKWPKETLDELIEATFAGHMILDETHPAWLRLVGSAQKLS